eukprot:767338-Hanusia_phi.AAC.5
MRCLHAHFYLIVSLVFTSLHLLGMPVESSNPHRFSASSVLLVIHNKDSDEARAVAGAGAGAGAEIHSPSRLSSLINLGNDKAGAGKRRQEKSPKNRNEKHKNRKERDIQKIIEGKDRQRINHQKVLTVVQLKGHSCSSPPSWQGLVGENLERARQGEAIALNSLQTPSSWARPAEEDRWEFKLGILGEAPKLASASSRSSLVISTPSNLRPLSRKWEPRLPLRSLEQPGDHRYDHLPVLVRRLPDAGVVREHETLQILESSQMLNLLDVCYLDIPIVRTTSPPSLFSCYVMLSSPLPLPLIFFSLLPSPPPPSPSPHYVADTAPATSGRRRTI